MAPPPTRRVSRRDRRQMTRTPSSTVSAPATTAAATSPIEWPTTAPGVTPYDFHVRASAIWMANRTGMASAGPSGLRPSSSSAQRSGPPSSANRPSRSSMASAKAGSSSRRRCAMPARCAPYPEKTHTGRPGMPSAEPVTTPGWGRPSARAVSPSMNPARSRAATAARARPRPARRCRVRATSASFASWFGSHSARRAAWSRIRSSLVSDSGNVRTTGRWTVVSCAGASSRTTCALVPPKPNPDTPRALGGPCQATLSLRDDREVQFVERDVRVGFLVVRAGRDHPVMQCEDGLDEPALCPPQTPCDRDSTSRSPAVGAHRLRVPHRGSRRPPWPRSGRPGTSPSRGPRRSRPVACRCLAVA